MTPVDIIAAAIREAAGVPPELGSVRLAGAAVTALDAAGLLLTPRRLDEIAQQIEALEDLPSVINAHARVALGAAADRVRKAAH